MTLGGNGCHLVAKYHRAISNTKDVIDMSYKLATLI